MPDNSGNAAVNVEKISAITLTVRDMGASVRFYKDILGLKMLYGGEEASFSSFRTGGADSAILNLELGQAVGDWGRIIFHVSDVDEVWGYLTEKGFNPERPRDAPWGERYFHMLDPDGHELSFARPLG